jgi:signal peptidase I
MRNCWILLTSFVVLLIMILSASMVPTWYYINCYLCIKEYLFLTKINDFVEVLLFEMV